LETFLRFQIRRDNDERSPAGNLLKQNRKKRLSRLANAGAGQRSAILQSPREGLHSGSFRDVSEQVACRFDCQFLRQAREKSQRKTETSSRRRIQGGLVRAVERQPLVRINAMFSKGLVKLVEVPISNAALVT
jgi:hypothetical protein